MPVPPFINRVKEQSMKDPIGTVTCLLVGVGVMCLGLGNIRRAKVIKDVVREVTGIEEITRPLRRVALAARRIDEVAKPGNMVVFSGQKTK